MRFNDFGYSLPVVSGLVKGEDVSGVNYVFVASDVKPVKVSSVITPGYNEETWFIINDGHKMKVSVTRKTIDKNTYKYDWTAEGYDGR